MTRAERGPQEGYVTRLLGRDVASLQRKGDIVRLTTAAGHKRDAVRVSAITALGELKDPDALPAIITGLHDPMRKVRQAAVTSLTRIPSADATTYLQESLTDPSVEVRSAAVEGLHTTAVDKSIVPTLGEAIRSSNTVGRRVLTEDFLENQFPKSFSHDTGDRIRTGFIDSGDERRAEAQADAVLTQMNSAALDIASELGMRHAYGLVLDIYDLLSYREAQGTVRQKAAVLLANAIEKAKEENTTDARFLLIKLAERTKGDLQLSAVDALTEVGIPVPPTVVLHNDFQSTKDDYFDRVAARGLPAPDGLIEVARNDPEVDWFVLHGQGGHYV